MTILIKKVEVRVPNTGDHVLCCLVGWVVLVHTFAHCCEQKEVIIKWDFVPVFGIPNQTDPFKESRYGVNNRLLLFIREIEDEVEDDEG